MYSQWNQTMHKTKILYRFQLQLEQIKLNIPLGCKVLIEWGRKNLKAKSQCRLERDLSRAENLYSIRMLERLVLDQKISSNNVSSDERQNYIKVILEKNGVAKLGGSLKFYLNEAVKPSVFEGITKFNCHLENTPDSVSYLKFSINYTKIEEVPNFYSSTGSFRSKSPSNVSRSPESQIRKPALVSSPNMKTINQSPRNVNFAPFQMNNPNQNSSQTQKLLKQAQMKISQLMTTITGFKSELHIKTKEVEMLRDNEKLQAEGIQRERIEMNNKVLMTLSEVNQLEDEFKKVKRDNNVLQVEVQRLKMELIRSQRAKQRVEQQLFELRNKLKLMECKQQQGNRYLKSENDRLKYELFDTQSRIFKLQQEYKSKVNANEDHGQISATKMSQLEYQNITLTRELRQMEERLSDYEEKSREWERISKEKEVEAQLLKEKLVKVEKSSLKEQQFSQSAYLLLEEKCEMTIRELEEKREILSSINYEYEQVMRQKDQEIEMMRNKFNSFMHKTEHHQG